MKKFNLIIQIVAGIIMIGAFIGFKEIIFDVINQKLPVWIAFMACLTSFILGLTYNRLKHSYNGFYQRDIKRLTFDNLPKHTEWEVGFDSKPCFSPIITIREDGFWGNYWHIEEKDTYYLDYSFSSSLPYNKIRYKKFQNLRNLYTNNADK